VSSHVLHLHLSPRVLIPAECRLVLRWRLVAFGREVGVLLWLQGYWLELLLPGQEVLHSGHVQCPPEFPQVLQVGKLALGPFLPQHLFVGVETGGARDWLSVVLEAVGGGDGRFGKREGGRVEYLGGSEFQQVLLGCKQGVAFKRTVAVLLPETEGLRHDTGALGERIVVDIDMEGIYEIGEAGGELGRHELPLLEQKHLLVDLLDQQFELILIARLPSIKLQHSLLQSYHQHLQQIVVFRLLPACGKSAVHTHKIIIC
jgi:hypothetical protein